MPLSRLVLRSADVRFDVLVMHDNVVVLRKLFQLHDELCRIYKVDYKHAEEKSYHEGERQIVGQPRQSLQNVRMHKIGIDGAEGSPRKRELRTDDALYVAPLVAVIPQADLHHLQAENTCDVLYDGHRHGGQEKQGKLVPNRVFYECVGVKRGDKKQYAQTEAVQRDIRSRAEAGVYPFPLRVAA